MFELNDETECYDEVVSLGIGSEYWPEPALTDDDMDGVPNDWHFSHLSTFARAGIGCIFAEATAVTKEGRITPFCLGLWNDEQMNEFKPIVRFIKKMGSIPAFQLAHAGRKAGTKEPWRGGLPLDEEDKKNGNR